MTTTPDLDMTDPDIAAGEIEFEDPPEGVDNLQAADGDTPEDKPADKPDDSAPTPDDTLPSPEDILKGEKAAEAPAEPEPEKDSVDDIAEPANLSEDSKKGWSALKEEAKARQSTIRELETKLAKYESGDVSAATSARIKELETQLAETTQKLVQYDARNDPTFQSKYVAPVNAAIAEIKDLAKEFEVDVTDVNFDEFRTMTLKQAAEKLRDIAPGEDILHGEIMRRVTEIRKLSRESDSMLQNAQEFVSASREQQAAQLRQTFDRVSSEFTDNWLPIQVDEAADDAVKKEAAEYNQGIQQIRATAEQIALGQTSPDEVARVAHEAAQYRFMLSKGLPRLGAVYQQKFNQLQARIGELESELAGVTKAKPKIDGTSGGEKAKGYAEMSNEEAAADLVFG